MNASFEYYLRLTRFRNIDLPLQGLYFVQVRFDRGTGSGYGYQSQIVPYSANCNDNSKEIGNQGVHCLFPPQISPDDALQSSGFVIQFSEESVLLFDSFRLSLKDTMYFTKGGGDNIPSLCGSVKAFDQAIRLQVDLLFSTGDESGGVEMLKKTNFVNFPTEYTVVASQSYLVQPPGSGAEFFRIPLGLLRENSTLEEESGFLSGDVYPCAFVEGVLCSIMTQIHFPTGILGKGITEFVQQMSTEVCGNKTCSFCIIVGYSSA